jgi:long-chain acyl-CoA synthetase
VRVGLGYLFDTVLVSAARKVALIQGEQALAYGELDARANRTAWALRHLGVSIGDRVALLFDNDWRFLECWLGGLRAGGVVVPINHRLTPDRVAYILDNSESRVLLHSSTQAGAALTAIARLERPPIRVDVGGGAVDGGWTDGAPDGGIGADLVNASIAIQAYTAGSTGRPKGCLLTHGGQLWNLEAVLAKLSLTPEDRALVATPVGHKNATMALKRFLRVGGSVVLQQAFDPDQYLAAVERHAITCTTGVPAMYQMLVAKKHLAGRYDTRSVRLALVASARVPDGLATALRTLFPNAGLQEIYGATEAGYLVQAGDGAPGLEAVPGTEVRIADEEGRECAAGESGEILFRNPGMTLGYYKNPEATAEGIRDGWYHTGDLGRVSEIGRYIVLGRRDDMIVTGGENVYPKEIEDVLLQHPRVSEVCVVSVPHAIKGQVPVAFVVLPASESATEAELKEFFLAHAAAYAHPRRVFFVGQLPLSAPGKIDRSVLRKLAEAATREEFQGAENAGK